MNKNQQQTPPPFPTSQGNGNQPRFSKKKTPLWAKCLIGAAVTAQVAVIALVAGSGGESTDTDTTAVEATESEPKIKIDSAEVARLAPLFTENTDEFNGNTWVEPKSRPKYRNENACYAYFQKQDSVATNLRFVIQYTGDDWLFINRYTFLIDGKPVEVLPDKMERDNTSYVWEWSDNYVADNEGAMAVIQGMLKAKEVKIRCEGDKYRRDRTLSQKEVDGIVNTYKYYRALGGDF